MYSGAHSGAQIKRGDEMGMYTPNLNFTTAYNKNLLKQQNFSKQVRRSPHAAAKGV